MGRRGGRVLVAIGLALGTAIASVAWAGSASAATNAGAWELNEAPGARTAVDTSGYRQHGAVGSDISTGVRFDGATAYRFPSWASTPANHEIIVPHDARLEPGAGNFAVSMRMRTGRYFSNVVQKGQSGTPGGYWKIEVALGKIVCHFRNSAGKTVAVTSTKRYDNGKWHSVRCGRSGGTVSLYVDGVEQGARTGLTGTVGNTWVLAIGGKSKCNGETTGCDFFFGDIDYVRIQKG